MVYPIKDRRTSLQIDYFYLRRQVGAFLELGYSHSEWDDEQAETVDDVIRDGLMLYYFPPPLPQPFGIDITYAHEWSFMRPTWTFKTEDSQRRYPLPQDFERPIGEIGYSLVDNSFYAPIKQTSPTNLRNLEWQDTFTSYPQLFAVEPGESTGEKAQELLLVLHPTPDAAYELKLQYQAHARQLTTDQPFPLGGQVHGPGILAACLAVAEERRDGQDGPQKKKFFEVLAGNIVRDQQRGAVLLGYMGDGDSQYIRGRGELRDRDRIYFLEGLYGNTSYAGS